MRIKKSLLIAVLIVLALTAASCSKNKDANTPQTYGLPDVSAINAAPSDTFIVPQAALGALATSITPMPGGDSPCYHPGAHVVYASTGSVQSVDINSPVDGVVTYVNKCFPYGTPPGSLDQYKIHIAYAHRNGGLFELELGMEPMTALCSGAGSDPDYYAPYILVAQGERVSKGQKIGAMVLVPGSQSHIHFNSKHQGIFMCPDIFTPAVIDMIDAYYLETCNGEPFSTLAAGTICYQPAPGESHTDY